MKSEHAIDYVEELLQSLPAGGETPDRVPEDSVDVLRGLLNEEPASIEAFLSAHLRRALHL